MPAPLARRLALASLFLFLTLGGVSARAATINVTPSDTYAKIEAAQAGDEVVIAPGTYKYRVYLTQQAPAANPIIIRAADPTNPPVWDLGSGLVDSAPGSYTAGDKGRGCWQLSGATNIHVSGLVITGCHNANSNSAGLRYYNGTRGIELSDIVFRGNDNGLSGGTENSEVLVQFCEFDSNGSLLASASAPTHNVYVYGGTFTLRYSYAHDPIQAQNFHIRAAKALLEYNWFARAKSYQGDLMPDEDYAGKGTFTQQLTLIGNVIFQGTTQQNASQIIAVYNDTGVDGLTLNVALAYNTFVGPSSGHGALVHLSNADGTPMTAELDNNLIVGAGAAVNVEDSSAGHFSGAHNWLATGTVAIGLTGSVIGSDPMFKDAANEDFTLAASSTAVGAALETIGPTLLPAQEYYRNETVARMYRVRAGAHDIGAFESTTTGPGIGAVTGSGGGPPGMGGGPPGMGGGGKGGGAGGVGPKTGGNSGTAGRPGTGGAGLTGGGTGGISGVHTGGTTGTGHTGGTTGTGGQPLGTGGWHSTGGIPGHPGGGAGGAGGLGGTGAPPGSGGGCDCGVHDRPAGGPFALILLAITLCTRRRQRRRN